MAFAKRLLLGQTTLGPQIAYYEIAGESIAKGDSSDRLTNPGSEDNVYLATGAIPWGWNRNLGLHRHEPGAFIPLRDIVPAFSRIFAAVLHVRIDTKGEWGGTGGSTIPGVGYQDFAFYGVRRPGWDRLDYDFHYYDTSATLAWGEYGAQVGTDLTAAPAATLRFAQVDVDFINANPSIPLFKTMDIKGEVQYCSDRNLDVQLIALLSAPSANPGSRCYLTVRSPAVDGTELARPHSYLEVYYVPPIVLHGALVSAGRGIDLAKVLDKDSLESQYHLYMGFVDQGETGDPQKYWVRNTRLDRIAKRIVIECTRSFANVPVAKSTNTGSKALRSVDTYQLHLDNTGAVDELTPRGAWYVIFTDATHISLYFQANFTGSYVLQASGISIGADYTLIDTGVTPNRKLLKIRTAKWSGTAITNDRLDFDTASDTTSPTYPADSKAMMSFIPPTVLPAGDVADTAKEKPISGGATQRLRAGTYDYNDAGTTRSVVLLADTQIAGYVVDRPCYVFDGTGFQAVKIKQIFLTADALPTGAPGGEVGDGLLLYEQLTRSYAAGAYLTPGLYVDTLAKSSDAFVNGSAATAQALVDLQTPVDWLAGDVVTAISLSGASAGQAVQYIVQTTLLSGARVQFTTNLSVALVDGDILVKQVTSNAASFFMRGTVPEGATLGDRLALVRTYEARSSLQNII